MIQSRRSWAQRSYRFSCKLYFCQWYLCLFLPADMVSFWQSRESGNLKSMDEHLFFICLFSSMFFSTCIGHRKYSWLNFSVFSGCVIFWIKLFLLLTLWHLAFLFYRKLLLWLMWGIPFFFFFHIKYWLFRACVQWRSPGFLVFLFCPPKLCSCSTDDHSHWTWLYWEFHPVKRELFLFMFTPP